jgi:putative ABC transport system permease protein
MIPFTYSVRSLRRRPLTAIVTTIGLSLVVFVFAAILMVSRGVHETLARNGSPDNALILRDGATSEATSILSRDQVRLLTAEPEFAVAQDGSPLLDAEVVVIGSALRSDGTGSANVGLRGIGDKALAVRRAVKIVRGHAPRPGTLEVMIGVSIEGRYIGAGIGDSIAFARRQWPVVGVFEAEGSGFESEIWTDEQQLLDAYNRPVFSEVVARVKDRASLATLSAKIAADPALSTTKVWREDEFFDAQSETLRRFVTMLGTFVAVIFAIAAAMGAAITMYAQVSARIREVGTLRAIGFGRRTVLTVFLREAVILSVFSGLIGTIAASLLSMVTFSTMNMQSFTLITFHFSFGVGTAVAAFIFSIVMGIAGGFSPALGAARLTIVNAVRGNR